ncbi:MAG: hypothetical protein Q7T33_08765 [Dehalococcoidia bacterium]|nr:hypothetical protein [Dehalococcoidia bacterium]
MNSSIVPRPRGIRRWLFPLAATAAAFLLLSAAQDEPPVPPPPRLQGVTAEQLRDIGIAIYAPHSDSAGFSPEAARAYASGKFGRGVVREVVLAWLVDESGTGFDREVWVVNYDPATVPIVLIGGPNSLPDPLPELKAELALDFLDAETGDFLLGVVH